MGVKGKIPLHLVFRQVRPRNIAKNLNTVPELRFDADLAYCDLNQVPAPAQAPEEHPKTDSEGSNFCAFLHSVGAARLRVTCYLTMGCVAGSRTEAQSGPHVALTEPGIAFCGATRARPAPNAALPRVDTVYGR